MNLKDYKRMARVMFGESREMDLFLEQVWDSACRAGAASKAERKTKVLVDEWDWDEEWDGLVEYVARERELRLDHAAAIIKNDLEDMRLWARAKGERKIDWTSALKGWMRRNWGQTIPRTTGTSRNQTDLFGPTSPKPSTALSRVEAGHRETFCAAMEINSQLAPPSRCNTSSATGSAKTRPALPVSSRTPH